MSITGAVGDVQSPAALSFSESEMRTVVLGAPGQLGRDLCPRLPGDVIPLARADVDLTDADRLRQILTDRRPDVVVNCAAYNFVDKAETEPAAAFDSQRVGCT